MNRSLRNIILFLVLITLINCEKRTEPDTTPPTVIITNPLTGTTAHELLIVKCVATDNVKINNVELWIDGVATTITDETEPYSLIWDTTQYENESSHTITVRAYDESGNKTDSDAIILTVDNTESYPTAVEILSIIFQEESFLISWTQNLDNDYFSYSLYESTAEDMSEETMIYESYDADDTSYIVTGINENETRFYQITVADTFNLETKSNILAGNGVIKIVYMNFDNDGGIFTMGINGTNQTQLTINTDNGYDMEPVWKRDGTQIYFIRDFWGEQREIYSIDLYGNNEVNLTHNQGYNYNISLSGDSEKIVFCSYGYYPNHYPIDIFIMNSDGSNKSNLTNDETSDGYPDISYDGERIVWSSERTGNHEIFIMNSDGSNQNQLTDNIENNNGFPYYIPIFSPDGSYIIFRNDGDIFRINSDGENLINLTNIGCGGACYKFTPDGSKIAFISHLDNELSYDIFVINADGSNLTNLTNGFGNCGTFDISEDGQRIVFSSYVNDNSEIYIMNIDGNNRTRITNTSFNEDSPKFQPYK